MPTALVTGSSRGIGATVARRFARDGYDVVINYHSSGDVAEELATEIQAETDQHAVAVQGNVRNPNEATALVDATVDAFGGVDHVVNNAGVAHRAPSVELSYDNFDRLMEVNLRSAFAVSKAAIPHLKSSNEPAGPSIVNMSSVVIHTGGMNNCHYAASKNGLVGLTKSHATEFAPDIRVNALAPGLVETDMTADRTEDERATEEKRIPLDRYGTPAEIADAAAYLRDAKYVTGETLNVNGGLVMR